MHSCIHTYKVWPELESCESFLYTELCMCKNAPGLFPEKEGSEVCEEPKQKMEVPRASEMQLSGGRRRTVDPPAIWATLTCLPLPHLPIHALRYQDTMDERDPERKDKKASIAITFTPKEEM